MLYPARCQGGVSYTGKTSGPRGQFRLHSHSLLSISVAQAVWVIDFLCPSGGTCPTMTDPSLSSFTFIVPCWQWKIALFCGTVFFFFLFISALLFVVLIFYQYSFHLIQSEKALHCDSALFVILFVWSRHFCCFYLFIGISDALWFYFILRLCLVSAFDALFMKNHPP